MKTVRFRESKPLPSYLVAFAAGRFDAVAAGRVGDAPLRIITPHGHAAEAQYAAQAIPQLLALEVKYFGRPYPYEKLDSIAMPVSNFAMENAGLITYGQSTLLANPAGDTITRQREMAIVAAHEMAHQWFGDLVTTDWWNDIWLNEAFASWMEEKITGEWKPDWKMDVEAVESRLTAMRADSLVSARRITEPIESEGDIANAFDDITYQKGDAVIRMFEHYLGEEPFRRGVQLYLNRYAWRTATTPEFLAAVSEGSGRDVAPAFGTFVDQTGVPHGDHGARLHGREAAARAFAEAGATHRRSRGRGRDLADSGMREVSGCRRHALAVRAADRRERAAGASRSAELSHVAARKRPRRRLLSRALRRRSAE